MKVAVLADIHGNLAALEQVTAHIDAWGADHIIMAGDVVNRGPQPRACWEVIEERQRADGWQLVRGNHEDYVLVFDGPDAPTSGPELEIYRNAYWTYRRLRGKMSGIRAMPFQVSLPSPDGLEFRIVHASMLGNRIGIYPNMPVEHLRQLITPPPAVLCVGHTHRPLVRQVDETLVVNAGSVGMPFDGDWRAAYAQLTWQNGQWRAKIVRLTYGRERTEEQFYASGFIPNAGPLARIMLTEFQQSRSHMHLWISHYEPAVLEGSISMEESVQRYLQSVK